MPRNYREAPKEKKSNPFNPLIGFFILIALTAASYFASAPAHEFITSTPYSMPFFGQILPLNFPNTWPVLAQQAVVGLFVFLTFLIFFMVIAMLIAPSAHAGDETYVDLGELRKEREKRAKEREKAARKAARRRRR